MTWAEASFTLHPFRGTTNDEFLKGCKKVFDHPDYQANASLCLMSRSQGLRTVSNYTIEFWTLAAEMD